MPDNQLGCLAFSLVKPLSQFLYQLFAFLDSTCLPAGAQPISVRV